MEQEFNLIDEPWIRVRTADCAVKEVSLKDVLLNAQNYQTLSGETKTQDFAILRLLLAVVHTVFSRYDEQGNDLEDYNPDLIDNWVMMWESGKFPAEPFEKYFSKWHENFWLFDEKKPFYQSIDTKNRVVNPARTAKIIGTLFESENKGRLFSDRFGDGRNLTYSEAARWLPHIVCFDDRGAKCFDDRPGKQVPKMTWASKLSLFAAVGNNLFSTIMLNYNVDYGSNSGAIQQTPSWECETVPEGVNRLVAIPNNQAALLTLRSRDVLFHKENGMVTMGYVSGGDYFDEEDVNIEQMTMWKRNKDKKNPNSKFRPKRYDTSKKAWQEFGSMAGYDNSGENENNKNTQLPGVMTWIQKLVSKNHLPRDYHVKIEMAAVIYNLKQSTSTPVIDSASDTLSFHAQLLTDVGIAWRMRIQKEIENCDKAAYYIGKLYRAVQLAEGRRDKDEKTEYSGENNARIRFYEKIDRPFRIWLAELDPNFDEDYSKKLRKIICQAALDLGASFVSEAGNPAIFGRIAKDDKGAKVMSAAMEYNIFKSKIKKTFELAGENSEQK